MSPALPRPGQGPQPSLVETPAAFTDPDYEMDPSYPSTSGSSRRDPGYYRQKHDPLTCEEEHCSCHLPKVFSLPTMSLTGREALVLAWHLFPLGDDTDLSFEEIGQRLGVRPERARQIYQRAAAKIRAFPRAHYPPRPGTDEYNARMERAEQYKAEHPEYPANRALLDAMDQMLPGTVEDGADLT